MGDRHQDSLAYWQLAVTCFWVWLDWKSDSSLFRLRIPCFSGNLKFDYRVYESAPLNATLNKVNTVYIPILPPLSSFLALSSHLVDHLNGLFSWIFSFRMFAWTHIFPMLETYSSNFNIIHPNNIVSYSRNRPWTPLGLRDVKDATLSRQSAHRRRYGCHP
jgi:hypothetical protein